MSWSQEELMKRHKELFPDPVPEPPAKFVWASIAGADPEPVERIEVDGREGVLTTGCPDPFWLDDKSVKVRIYVSPVLKRPKNLLTQYQVDKEDREYRARLAAKHGWRGPR